LLLVFLITLCISCIRRSGALTLRNVFGMNYVSRIFGTRDIIIVLYPIVVISIVWWVVRSTCLRSMHDCAISKRRRLGSGGNFGFAMICRCSLVWIGTRFLHVLSLRCDRRNMPVTLSGFLFWSWPHIDSAIPS